MTYRHIPTRIRSFLGSTSWRSPSVRRRILGRWSAEPDNFFLKLFGASTLQLECKSVEIGIGNAVYSGYSAQIACGGVAIRAQQSGTGNNRRQWCSRRVPRTAWTLLSTTEP